MATLAERLRARIEAGGPVTFRDWMEAALYDERGGYYRRGDLPRWGRAGDYRTAPERTPLFAATFARHFATLHERLGSPPRFTLLEAGAGAGHFAHAALETLARDHPAVFDAIRYLVDEASEDSRARVRSRLADFAPRFEFTRLEEFGGGELGAGIVFANELLDALPAHRVRRVGGRLLEQFVGLDTAGKFARNEREPTTPRLADYFSEQGVTLAEGQSAEVNLAAEEWIARAANAIARGFVITVDYGAEAAELYDPRLRPDGSLRAFRSHQFAADPLRDPGLQDLTTTVNWTRIKQAGERAGLRTHTHERLDRFLLEAGVVEQLERLAALAPDEAARTRLRLAARDMILPGGMAESFQVLVQEK